MEMTSEELASHKKAYLAVGIALFVLTSLTLAFGIWPPFDFGKPGIDTRDVVAGLVVAVVKSSLVALIFMHLNHERGLIYKILLFTFCFFTGLMFLLIFAWGDHIHAAFEAVHGSLT